MSRESVSYRTPLSRARGLGSSHGGTKSFISERVSGVALVPLCLWAVWAAIKVGPVGYAGGVTFLQSPFNAVMGVLLIAVSCRHMQGGMQVVIEDYVHDHKLKYTTLLLNGAVCWLVMALGVFCVLKVALLGAR